MDLTTSEWHSVKIGKGRGGRILDKDISRHCEYLTRRKMNPWIRFYMEEMIILKELSSERNVLGEISVIGRRRGRAIVFF